MKLVHAEARQRILGSPAGRKSAELRTPPRGAFLDFGRRVVPDLLFFGPLFGTFLKPVLGPFPVPF